VSLTVVIVSLQILVDVDTSAADFKVDAELEQTFVLTHQLRQSHFGLDTKHLWTLSITQQQLQLQQQQQQQPPLFQRQPG